MNVINFEDLRRTDYNILNINSIEMPQRTDYPIFSSIGCPKAQDMLLLVNDCKTKYITKDKQILTTQSGDVVYVPKGSEYQVECIESAQKSSTLQINFSLFDEDFKPFILSDSICIFSSHNPNIRSLFEKMMLLGTDTSCSIAQNKSVLYDSWFQERQGCEGIRQSRCTHGLRVLVCYGRE